jgi:glycosyltransferase involved in cell wall biosynthesis
VTAPAEPRVSVVVPTRGRPDLVVRAVRSALAQSVQEIEVVVVADGPDDATTRALGTIDDPRLVVEVLPEPRSVGAARNAGVRIARGRWIAFLDDDDEWAADKLAVQLPIATGSAHAHPIVTCRVAVIADDGRKAVWPRRVPAPGEPLDEYLFVRRTPFWGEALVQTSTLLVGRDLAMAVPFDERLAKHEDLDWLLRSVRMANAAVTFVPSQRPLATWHVETNRSRASTVPDWRQSIAWLRSTDGLVSPRAYAAFCLTWVAAAAARERSAEALWRLPWEACRRGRPRVRDVLLYLGIWAVPAGARDRLGYRLTRSVLPRASHRD